MTLLLPGILGAEKHVVMVSGGGGSFRTAQRAADRHGTRNLTLLYTDTLIEHRDCYRLLIHTACSVFGLDTPAGVLELLAYMPEFHEDPVSRVATLERIRSIMADAVPGLIWLAEGRDPWGVFFDRRFLGNSRIDPCSKILKRDMADRWLSAHCDPALTTVYVGMDWTEEHRFIEARERYARKGYRCEAPLCEAPYLPISWKKDLVVELQSIGITIELYILGFPHNNCGGFCIKAGQAFFALLLRTKRDVYLFHEQKEQDIRLLLGDVSILKDRRGGVVKTLTLRDFRERLEAGGEYDRTEFGSCGCFVGQDANDELPVIYRDGTVQPLLGAWGG